MDANLVLLWFVGLASVSPLRAAVGAARAGRPAGLVMLLAVIAGTTLAAALDFEHAGGWGMTLFGVLVLAPALLQRRVHRLSLERRYASALPYARVLALLHPTQAARAQIALCQALAAARSGDFATAQARLLALSAGGDTPDQLEAALHLARLTGDFPRYLARSARLPDALLRASPNLLLGRLRALAECGELTQLVETYATHASTLEPAPLRVMRAQAQLIVLTFCGRLELSARLLDDPRLGASAAARHAWLAIAAFAAGSPSAARTYLDRLLQSGEPDLALSARQRFDHPPRLAQEALSTEAQRTLDAIEQGVLAELATSGVAPLKQARLMQVLVALNLVAFGFEELLGGSEDGATLYRLGALTSGPLSLAESYRLVTKLFLHYGPLHLGLNMAGLLAVGPGVERALGWLRTLVLYLAAGVAGSLLEALLPSEELQLFLGASGCIMGLLGATAALVIRDFRQHGTAALRQRLGRIGFVLVAQLAFDLSVPNISLIAHWVGVGLGFGLGLGFARKPPPVAGATAQKQDRNGGMSADAQGR